MNIPICGHLNLHFQIDPVVAFFPLLQKGFYIENVIGNLEKMLCQTCGLDPDQVHDRIQTVFLNGKPVDDMKTTYVRDGDCLALSAAMPGLVGATMRLGGVLAGFRHSISHRASGGQSHPQGGVFMIKLFNLLIKEIGPRFLQQGILAPPGDLRDFLEDLSEADWENCTKAVLNGQEFNADSLTTMVWPSGPGYIHMKVAIGRP